MSRKPKTLWHIAALLVVGIVNSVLACLEINAIVRRTFAFLGALAIVTLIHKGTWLHRVLIIVVAYIYISILDTLICYGVSYLLELSFKEMVLKRLLYAIVITASKLIQLLTLYICLRLKHPTYNSSIRRKWLLLTILFPTVSLYALVMFFEICQELPDLPSNIFATSGFLAVANVAILYMINIMEKATKQEAELALFNAQMNIQSKSIEALKKSYQSQRQAIHDFHHHLQVIDDLITTGNIQESQHYIHQLQKAQTARIFCVKSNHLIIDAVINQKYQAAQEHNIDMQFHVNDLSNIPIPSNFLVVMLSNLLDNAIEACQKLEENRIIEVRLVAEDTLHLTIRNTSPPVMICGDRIPTTKEQPEEHGYGLTNVRHILNQLGAEYVYTYENGWFQFGAEIPFDGQS